MALVMTPNTVGEGSNGSCRPSASAVVSGRPMKAAPPVLNRVISSGSDSGTSDGLCCAVDGDSAMAKKIQDALDIGTTGQSLLDLASGIIRQACDPQDGVFEVDVMQEKMIEALGILASAKWAMEEMMNHTRKETVALVYELGNAREETRRVDNKCDTVLRHSNWLKTQLLKANVSKLGVDSQDELPRKGKTSDEVSISRLMACPVHHRTASTKRQDRSCVFAHPTSNVAVSTDGFVTVCEQYRQGQCTTDQCRHFHSANGQAHSESTPATSPLSAAHSAVRHDREICRKHLQGACHMISCRRAHLCPLIFFRGECACMRMCLPFLGTGECDNGNECEKLHMTYAEGQRLVADRLVAESRSRPPS